MAVVDKNAVDEKIKLIPVDIMDASLEEGVVEEIDVTKDAWDVPPPPPKGRYLFKIVIDKEGMKQGKREDNGKAYYVCSLECKLQDNKEFGNTTCFDRVDTRVWPGKDTSRMATLITKLGYKLPNDGRASDIEVARLFTKIMKKDQILPGDYDWRGYSKDQEKNVLVGMEAWPEKKNGKGHDHTVTINGEQVTARGYITRWHKKNEKTGIGVAATSGSGSSGSGNTATKAKATKPVIEDIEVVETDDLGELDTE